MTSPKIKNSLTAAALATLITLGGGTAAVASTYSPDNPSSGEHYSSEMRKPNYDNDEQIAHKAVNDRFAKKQFEKSKVAKNRVNSEIREELKELRSERALINKEFSYAVRKANSAFKLVMENVNSTESQILEAEAAKKSSIKEARFKKEQALKELRAKIKQFSKDYNIRVPKL